MKLLKDDQLKDLYTGADPVITGVQAPTNWTDAKSPVQPSSIDLQIGCVSVPAESTSQQPMQVSNGRHSLPPGQTAVVTTREHLHMPQNLAAIGFPPSHISVQGVLMTNPGHVDPGYTGPMHLTVINMGRDSFDLNIGAPIVTVLFFQLDDAVTAGYSTRNPDPIHEPDVNKLSRDFVNVEDRAERIARNAILRAGMWGAIAAAVLTVATQILPYYLGGIEEVKRNQAVLAEQVQTLRERVKSFEDNRQPTPGTTGGGASKLGQNPKEKGTK
jgi:dCTP deaminase